MVKNPGFLKMNIGRFWNECPVDFLNLVILERLSRLKTTDFSKLNCEFQD